MRQTLTALPLFVFLLGAIPAKSATSTFNQPYSVETFGVTEGATGETPIAGDFNNDGLDDFLIPGSSVRVLPGNDDLTFDAPAVTSIGPVFAQWRDAGYIDDDAILDLVIVDSSHHVLVFLGDGDGTFTQSASLTAATSAGKMTTAVVIADVTNDGDADVIALSSGLLYVWAGNGTGTFGLPVTSSFGGAFVRKMVTGHFSTDANLDLAFATNDGVSVAVGNGAGGFSTPVVLAEMVALSITTGDFAENGRDDLVVTYSPALHVSFIRIFTQDGSGVFTAAGDYRTVLEGLLTTADMNDDGALDVVSSADHQLAVHLGNGDGTFEDAIRHVTGSAAVAAVGEYSGDGVPDVIAHAFGSATEPARLMVGAGDGSLLLSRAYAPADGALRLAEATGDVHLDGVTFTRAGGTYAIVVIPGLGGGVFGDAILTDSGIPYSDSTKFGLGEFNGDGELDAVILDHSDGTLSTYFGDGDGTFTFGGATDWTGSTLFQVYDFTSDGRDDLVTRPPGTATMNVYPATGSGTFGAPIATSGVTGSEIGAGDVNGDGKLDAIAMSRVFLGNGNGTFTPGAVLNLPGAVLGVMDLDDDGDLDLLSTGAGSQDLEVRLGNGDGTFGAGRLLIVRGVYRGSQFVPGDVNGDGHTDAIGGGMVYLGDGDGWFTGYQWYAFASLTWPNVADLDGSGTTDIVALDDDSMAVLLTHTSESLGLPLGLELTADPNPSNHNQVVTFTAELTDSSFRPDGAVGFSVDGSLEVIDGYAFDRVAEARLRLPTGTHTIDAAYGRDAVFAPSADSLQQIVRKRTQTITLTASPSSGAVAGNPVTFRATVNAETSGSITFLANGTVIGSAPIVDGVAELTTTSLAAGEYVITAEHAGDALFEPSQSAPLPYEIGAVFADGFPMQATAQGTTVTIDWPFVSGATAYDVYRGTTTANLQFIGSMSAAGPFTDTTVVANTVYFYQVRAQKPGSTAVSMLDVATTVTFTDDPFVAGVTRVKLVHVTELRNAVNMVRAAVGLAPFTFTVPPAAGGRVRASHLTELRNAISQALAAIGRTVTFTDPSITAGVTPIGAVHWRELRTVTR